MNALIIYAHPNKKGHNGYILKKVEEELKERNQDYKVIDLYKEKYNPVMREDELYTHGGDKLYNDVKKHQELFESADRIILVYPIWWMGMPAILKGFFDRLLRPKFGYYFKPIAFNQGIPIGLFKDKKAAVFQTTTAHRFLEYLASFGRQKKQAKKDMLGLLGIKSKVYHVDTCLKCDEKQMQKIDRKVQKGVKKLLR